MLPLAGGSTAGLPAGAVPPKGVAWPESGGSTAGGGLGGFVGVEQLLLSLLEPHFLIAVCTDGTLRVFDLRAPAAPHMVLQPMGRSPYWSRGRGPGWWCAPARRARCGGST